MRDNERPGDPGAGGHPHETVERRLRGALREWLDPLDPPPARAYGPTPRARSRGLGALATLGATLVVVGLLGGPRLATLLTAPGSPGSPTPTQAGAAAGGPTSSAPSSQASSAPSGLPSAPSVGFGSCISAAQSGALCGASPPASAAPGGPVAARASPSAGSPVPTTGRGSATPLPRTTAPAATPTPGPGRTASPSPAPVTSPGQSITVTLADDGTTLQLTVGATFLLDLGLGYDWSVSVADQGVVARAPNILVIRGAQGVYQARAAGSTTLTATGNPACLSASPPCALPSRLFRLDIVVQ